MAKIRINGDTSGYIEISAPAIAGSTSITLPATTGGNFLVTDSSGNLNVDSGTLYVDATNNRVGIGTSSPSNTLHVAGTGSTQALFERTGSNGAFIGFKDGSGNSVFLGNTNGVFSIQTPGSSFSDKLVVTSAGLVGIGTSSPSSLLHVEGTSGNAKIRLGTGGDHTLIGPDSSGHTIINAGTAGGNMQLQLAGSTKVTLNSTGLGIGTTGPTELLSIGFADSSSGKLEFRTSTYSKVAMIEGSHDGGTANGSLRFWTRSGGTESERARIDSSGRLLVGTSSTSSSALLQVQGNSSSSTGDAIIQLRVGKNNVSILNGNSLGSIQFSNTESTVSAVIEAVADANWNTTNDYPSRLVFSTTADGASSPTERFRIANTGRGSYFSSSSSGFQFSSSPGASVTDNIIEGLYGATGVTTGTLSFLVRTNGNVLNTNSSYGALSDVKLKENIVDAASQWDDIKALKVRKYNFKEGQTHTQIGVIAQEVEQVSPGLVTESPDRDAEGNDLGTTTKAVQYSVLYMKAVKALQEAMERIEQLEAEMAEVKAQLS